MGIKKKKTTKFSSQFLNKSEQNKMYNFIRRMFQIIFCSIPLIILSPVILIISITVKLSSKGPILYKGKRLGKGRKIFIMYKFRTMYEGTEGKVGARLVSPDEECITKVGKIMRSFKLDELPQFINVIKGDMNLVGPRPLRLELYKKYVKEYPKYTERFKVKSSEELIGAKIKISKDLMKENISLWGTEETINTFIDNYRFTGRIDRIDQVDDLFEIIDYKTSSS